MKNTGELLERVGERFNFPEHTFDRLERRRTRKHRNQRISAGVVAIAIFVVTVWFAATGGSLEHTRTPASSGPTAPPGAANPIGVVGLPPRDATPSSPTRGELVVGLMFGHTMGDPGRFNVNVYADGRLIWQRLGDAPGEGDATPTGLIEQHLTPEGVELMRSEALSTGLFDHDLDLINSHGLYSGQVTVRSGDRLVRVTWGNIGQDQAATTQPTPEQVSALQGLDARLEDPASWLPASAWADPKMRAYVASRYSVCYETEREVGLDAVLASLPRPAEDLLRTYDRTEQHIEGFDQGTTLYIWCSAMTTDEARTLAAILEDAGVESLGANVFGIDYVVGRGDPSATHVRVSFAPMLPHEP